VDRHDPHNFSFLVSQQGHANLTDQRRFIPVTPIGRTIRKIEHHLRHARILQTGPDFRDQVNHAISLVDSGVFAERHPLKN